MKRHWLEFFFKVAALCAALACAGSLWHCNGENYTYKYPWWAPPDLSHCIPLWEAYWRLPRCGDPKDPGCESQVEETGCEEKGGRWRCAPSDCWCDCSAGDYGCPCLSSADCMGVCYGDERACESTCIGTCSGPDVNHYSLLGCHCTDWTMHGPDHFTYICVD